MPESAGTPLPPENPPAVNLSRRLAYLSLDESDAQRLRGMRGWSGEVADQFVEEFYRHLLTFEDAAKFLQSPALVARLKEAQKRHLATMLDARWDEAYVAQRQHVGDMHADVGIEPQLFLGAYTQYMRFCLTRLAEERPDLETFLPTALSLINAVLLDVGLTLEAYFAQSVRALRNALNMIWKANAELRQFAQLTSHDLKTPMATVANLCDEALDEFGDQMPAAARQLIEQARARTFRMSDMIDELLRETTREDALAGSEELALAEVVEEALDRLRPLAAQRGVQIVIDAPLPAVQGSRARLREALYNLLGNAIKFNDKPAPRVWVRAWASGGNCVLVVADNGPGIAPEELERIFAPFRRLPAHRDRPGSGLGLYFTKNLIEQQQGRVWAESELGHGSQFCIELPLGAKSSP